MHLCEIPHSLRVPLSYLPRHKMKLTISINECMSKIPNSKAGLKTKLSSLTIITQKLLLLRSGTRAMKVIMQLSEVQMGKRCGKKFSFTIDTPLLLYHLILIKAF